jgi:Cu/Ag efflux protein CusF
MRECLLVLMFVSASLVSYAAAGDALATHDDKASVEDGAKTKLTATVVSVDTEHKTISFEEITTPVAITPATVFDEDVQLDKLKPGTKVMLVLVTSADKKTEAVEVRKAG